ncbi:MAG: SMC-Scp complex subunit ScpB, partial [Terriglobales bacterium]
ARLLAHYAGDGRGIEIRSVAGGYRMATKPQHHEVLRRFIQSLQPPIRLSLAALETLAVVAYRQPVTAPEIKDIRGVDPAGVLNTLLERKLITTSGRKEVIGKPILYKTTPEFLLRFGLGGLHELPTLQEFEEMAKAGLEGIAVVPEEDAADAEPNPAAAPPAEPE